MIGKMTGYDALVFQIGVYISVVCMTGAQLRKPSFSSGSWNEIVGDLRNCALRLVVLGENADLEP